MLKCLSQSNLSIRYRKEGETYSPSEAEKIDIKFKLDQLIAVADLELKEDKLNRLVRLCVAWIWSLDLTSRARFQAKFLPKVLRSCPLFE